MAPIFASPDIAALVAAFPPPSPTNDQPSLVRSNSGTQLLSSTAVLRRFRALLETEPDRIKLSHLPRRLDIERIDWLLESYEEQIYHDKTGDSIISDAGLQHILQDLQQSANAEFVRLASFAWHADIAAGSLDLLLERERGKLNLVRFLQDNHAFISSQEHVLWSRKKIADAVTNAASDKLSLGQILPGVPFSILRPLATEALDELGGDSGRFEFTDSEVMFVPKTYEAALEDKQRAAYDARLQSLLSRLHDEGYCSIDQGVGEILSIESRKLVQDILDRYKHQHPDSNPAVIESRNSQGHWILVVAEGILHKTVQELKLGAVQLAKQSEDEHSSLDEKLSATLVLAASQPNLASILLKSDHGQAIEDVYEKAVAERKAEEQASFSRSFHDKLTAPIHLYSVGMALVEDATLRQRMDEYLSSHFRLDILPAFIRTLREQSSLQDKTRSKDLEKLAQGSEQAKTVADLEAVVSKFAKKQKLAHLSEQEASEVKKQALLQDVKAMQTMERGSDVLQHLIWILLAQKSEGLFMSSGKDTSRMLKQYQLVGDTEIGRKLELWRDSLKTGKIEAEDLVEMRTKADQALKAMYGHEANGTVRTRCPV